LFSLSAELRQTVAKDTEPKGKRKEETKPPPNPLRERRKEKNQESKKENRSPERVIKAVRFPFSRMGMLPPSRIRLSSDPPVAIFVKRLLTPQGWPRGNLSSVALINRTDSSSPVSNKNPPSYCY
jgi:hypothetical protein